VQFLGEHADQYRVLSIGVYDTLQPEFGSMYQIRQLSTMNTSLLPWYRDFYAEAFGSHSSQFLHIGVPRRPRLLQPRGLDRKALNAGSARYMIVSRQARPYIQHLDRKYDRIFENNKTVIYENPTARPVAYLTSRWKESGNIEDLGYDSIITTDSKLIEQLKEQPVDPSQYCDRLEIQSLKNTEAIYHTECNSPVILATSDSWHPGWKAEIDEESVPVGRVNQAFRAVVVPGGSHTVRMHYAPASIAWGLVTSAASVLLLVLMALTAHYRKRNVSPSALNHHAPRH
jgi:hypothetical protein